MENYLKCMENLEILCRARNEDLSNDVIVYGICALFVKQLGLFYCLFYNLLRADGWRLGAFASPKAVFTKGAQCWPFLDGPLWQEMLRIQAELDTSGREAHEKAAVRIVELLPVFERVLSALQEYYDLDGAAKKNVSDFSYRKKAVSCVPHPSAPVENKEPEEEPLGPWIGRFLDAGTPEKQLAVLKQMQGKVTQREVDCIFVALDLQPGAHSKSIDEQLDDIRSFILMRRRLDGGRMRGTGTIRRW